MNRFIRQEDILLKPHEFESKKILMIVRAFPPFLPVGHSIRAVKFIKYLPELGWLPVVLTVDDRVEYENMRKVGSASLLREIQPQVKIVRTTAGERSLNFLEKEEKIAKRNSLTSSAVRVVRLARRLVTRYLLLPDPYIAWLPFAVRRGIEIVKTEKINAIFATCPPHSSTLVGAFLKRLTGTPLILDYRDDWIDTPWYKSRPKLIRMIERKMEGWAVKAADKVVLVTEWSRRAFQERYPKEPADKFALIPNGCDLEEFIAINSAPRQTDNSKFTILHAGSLNDSSSWARSPKTFFEAVSNIIKLHPDLAEKISIVFAGDFPEGHLCLAKEMNLMNVVKSVGHLPHNEVLRLIKSADLLLAINYEGFATLIPGKIYEYWAVGGPQILLLSCAGAASNFIDEHRLGFTVEPSDVGGIQETILNVYRQSQTESPLRVQMNGIQNYDRHSLTQKLAQVLHGLSGQP